MAKGFGGQVKDALETFESGGTIEDAFEHVSSCLNGVIDEHGKKLAADQVRAVIRRELKATRDEDGLCEWASIERQNENGETVRVYKQLKLLDREDFRIHISYHAEQVAIHARTANSLTKRCNTVLGTRKQIPFPGFGLLVESEEHAPVGS